MTARIAEIVARALAEDLEPLGDLTSSLLPGDATVQAAIVPRRDGVLAGRAAAMETFRQVHPGIRDEWAASDGDAIRAGRAVARIEGPLAAVLTAERTALNFLCHLSGIATLTRSYVDAARPARVRDTRKTTPGLRALEKAAVRAGGGVNHRGSLSDGILVKDNHLGGLSIDEAVERARARWPGRTVEIECDTPDQVKAAAVAGADLVLLDNMSPEQVEECVGLVRTSPRPCLVEVSGGVTLDNVAAYAAAGADLIAVGALTHSAPALDLGLDLDPAG
ncbi:MAG: carboxylating nicotinate-nucleotide diphosphorylase [Acidimicrobiia bacterium]